MNHTKPTQEELEAGVNKAIEELDKDDTADTTQPSEPAPDASDETTTTEVETTPDTQEADDTQTQDEETTTEGEETKKDETAQKQQDYETRYKESQRQAIILNEQNRNKDKAIDQAVSTPEPTDEEMQAEYGARLDDMSDTERILAKDNLWNKKRFSVIETASQQRKDADAWNTKVDEFADNPETLNKFPDLEGKVGDFKVYAAHESRRNVDFEVLTAAFLFDKGKAKKENKGTMFPVTGGGTNTKPVVKNDKLSLEEGQLLMQKNYPKYKELLLAGKIAAE